MLSNDHSAAHSSAGKASPLGERNTTQNPEPAPNAQTKLTGPQSDTLSKLVINAAAEYGAELHEIVNGAKELVEGYFRKDTSQPILLLTGDSRVALDEQASKQPHN